LSSSQSYRYFSFVISNTGNPDGYIEIGEMFTGEYLELNKSLSVGYTHTISTLTESQITSYGIKRDKAYNQGISIRAELLNVSDADYQSLLSMMESIFTQSNKSINPIYFNTDSDSPNDSILVNIYNLPSIVRVSDYRNVNIEMKEVMAKNA